MKALAWPMLEVAVALNWWALTAPTELNIRLYFKAMACGNSLASTYLQQYGSTAFPAYENILTNSESKPRDVAGTLCALSSVGGNRTRFVQLALQHLTSDNAGVRYQAAKLLEQIGSSNEGILLVALLSDRDLAVVTAATEALAAKGGHRELAALDLWLKTADIQNRELLRHAQKQRDLFKKRLDEENKKLRDGG